MIVVSGASGKLGRRTVEYLRERVDASSIVAASRAPEKIADLGVTTRQADFDQPDGLERAFDGAERLLLISTDSIEPGIRVRQHTNAIRAAAKAGVGHVIYTSIVQATEPGNPVVVAADHSGTEKALEESGLSYTALRESVYMDTQLMGATSAVASGVLAGNEADGAIGYVTRDDIAAVAAALLADGGPAGVLDVTGPAAVTQSDIAAALTEVTGVQVSYQPLSDEEVVDGMVQQAGMPEAVARAFSTFGVAAREGFLDNVSDTVQRFAGRAPTSIQDFLAANRATLLG